MTKRRPAMKIRTKEVRIGGRTARVPAIRFKRHRTPTALLRVFFRPMGVEPREMEGAVEHMEDMRRMGAWGFSARLESPPTVHYWAAKDVDPLWLAMLLGHEVGHLSGKPLRSRRNDWSEELRADEYGAAAFLAMKQILRRKR